MGADVVERRIVSVDVGGMVRELREGRWDRALEVLGVGVEEFVRGGARAAAARGAALLDEARPGWWGRIDVGVLAMQSCSECVLGQLFHGDGDGVLAGYGAGRVALGPSAGEVWGVEEMWARVYGFNAETAWLDVREVARAGGVDEMSAAYDVLRAAWVGEIEARVASA